MSPRRPFFTIFWNVVALLLVVVTTTRAQTPPPTTSPSGKTVYVLAIGNSFSNNATVYLKAMASEGGHRWVFGHAMIGGASLERHMTGVRAFEADPADVAGRPYKIMIDGKLQNVSLKHLLTMQPWEYVTIQQASFLSYKPETFEPAASQLVAYVRQYAPQAKLLIHETWAYRADHGSFKDGFDQQQMYRRLHDNYQWLADYHRAAGIIPVGTAFQNVREDPRWQPQRREVDLSQYQHPKLPPEDIELTVGYTWNTRVTPFRIQPDRGHASAIGKYLGACVWYEFFFGDVRGNTFRPRGVSEEHVALMQDIAHKTVAEGLRPKAADVPVRPLPLPTTQPLPPLSPTTAPAAPDAN